MGKTKANKEQIKILIPKQIAEITKKLEGSLEAVLLDKTMNQIERLPVSELAEKLKGMNDIETVVFDGVMTQRLVNIAIEKNIKYLVAARILGEIKPQLEVKLITFSEIQC